MSVPRSLFVSARVSRVVACVFIPLVLALGVGSCGKKHSVLAPNVLPTLTIGAVVIDTTRTPADDWSASIEWTASDPDGVSGAVEYAVDPAERLRFEVGEALEGWLSEHDLPLVLTAAEGDGYLLRPAAD